MQMKGMQCKSGYLQHALSAIDAATILVEETAGHGIDVV